MKLNVKNVNLERIFLAMFLIVGTIPALVSNFFDLFIIEFVFVISLPLIGFFILRKIVVRPIKELIARSQAVLEGDLTEEIAVKAIGEIGVLGNTVNEMTRSLRNMAIKIKNDAKNLTEVAISLSAAANQSEKAIQELAATLEEASASTQEQNANTEELQATFEEMGAAIEEISASAEQASSVANKAIQTSQDGVDAVENVVQRLVLVDENTEIMKGVISKLEESSQQISKMVQLITHIAEQTNLLALNATIEAARAGEYGRGFSVVANEIRKLADESADAAKGIIQIVNNNLKETQQAVNSVIKVKEEIMISRELADKAKSALSVIMNSTLEINQNSASIASAVEQQSVAIQAMMQAIETIASAAQQIASGSQQASATIEEQLATANLINESSSSLQNLAEELEKLIGTFKTE